MKSRTQHSMRRWRFRRKGQSLVEFSLVALVLYFLFAGILTFGQLLFDAQTSQSAADTAAREIARLPLPPATSVSGGPISLYDVLYNPAYNGTQVRNQVFDPKYLMVNLTTSLPAGMSLADWVKTWPVVNQMLYPLMIVNYVDASSTSEVEQEWLLYPGVVMGKDSNGWPAYRVALVTNRDPTTGAETIEWVPVIEETLQDTPSSTVPDDYYGFNLQSQYRGLVGLRINCPYQSATMSAYQETIPPPPTPNVKVIPADDSGVVISNPGDFTPSPSVLTDAVYPTYGGSYGLGSQQAWLTQVRPFRRLLSTQAVARREVFQNSTSN